MIYSRNQEHDTRPVAIPVTSKERARAAWKAALRKGATIGPIRFLCSDARRDSSPSEKTNGARSARAAEVSEMTPFFWGMRGGMVTVTEGGAPPLKIKGGAPAKASRSKGRW